MEEVKYYKFDIGDGAMRRRGCLVDYLDENGNWVENRELFRTFVGGDADFDEISYEEAERLIEVLRKKKENVKHAE